MTTCLTSSPKIHKTAFMGFDSADMQAPLAPCADRDGAVAAVVQDDLIDLAASTFRPTAHSVLADLKRTKIRLTELQAPIVEELRDTLQRLYEVKSLGSTAENAQAAATVNRLAKSGGMDLTYKENPVALVFNDDERYKAGTFRLRALSADRKCVYERTSFPLLELTPTDPAAAQFRQFHPPNLNPIPR